MNQKFFKPKFFCTQSFFWTLNFFGPQTFFWIKIFFLTQNELQWLWSLEGAGFSWTWQNVLIRIWYKPFEVSTKGVSCHQNVLDFFSPFWTFSTSWDIFLWIPKTWIWTKVCLSYPALLLGSKPNNSHFLSSARLSL